MIEFALPSLGPGMVEGKLLRWKIVPGQPVRRGDVVAVVDTPLAPVEVESEKEGTVLELLVEAGATVPVGTVLAIFLEAGESPRTARRGKPAVPEIPPVEPGVIGRRRILPVARTRAAELGIDLDTVTGTGPDGEISLEDVELAVLSAVAQPAVDKQAEMRKAVTAAVTRSKREIPHYYLSEPVPMASAQDWLASANAGRDPAERLLMEVLQLKAVALALKAYPDLNGWYAGGGFRPAPSAHIGVAIPLRQGGLIAPAIHDVGAKSLDELTRDLTNLVARARSGSLRSAELADTTASVTNLGKSGVDAVFGIIYPPQVALVGFGRIAARPWVVDGAVAPMPLATASLAADHRVTDGLYGALFLAALRELLQRPERL
jgi:pyruvate dehydrogenase E2 component (dihydrolipoamide acetyltransferase)